MAQLSKSESEALKQFQRERIQKWVVNTLFGLISLVGAIFVISLFSGGRFAYLMGQFGFKVANEKTGVYADCSKAENRSSPYCAPKERSSDRNWRSIGQDKEGKSQFSLHGR